MNYAWLRRTRVGFAIETALRGTPHRLPDLPHWHSPLSVEPVMADVRHGLHAVAAMPGLPLSTMTKGHPDTVAVKQELAAEVESHLAHGRMAPALATAHRLASCDMTDAISFAIYLDLCRLMNAAALEAARRSLSRFLVLHVSCTPRLDRAMASVQSFVPAEAAGVSQLVVVGSRESERFQFDAVRRVLTVPTRDDYESLPSKVIAGFFFLSLLGGVDGVLKVDDDHRLRDREALRRAFARLSHAKPLQIGALTRIRELGRHPRAWHFGKCADPAVDRAVFTLPGTTRWANGSSGYLLNGPALQLMRWSHVYFPDYIRLGLYEDMVVSDLIERQGGRLGLIETSRFLQDVAHY